MIFKIQILIPDKIELFLAKCFGVRQKRYCLNSWVETVFWRNKFYVIASGETPHPRDTDEMK